VLVELAKLKPPSARYRGTPQRLAPVTGSRSDKITMAALYPPLRGVPACRRYRRS
jgi:indolepyruvate decarboxylase